MKRNIYEKDFKEFQNKMFGGIDGVTDFLITLDNHKKKCEDSAQNMDEYADCIENIDQKISKTNKLFLYRRRFHNSQILDCFQQNSDTRDYDVCKKQGLEKSEVLMKEYLQNIQ